MSTRELNPASSSLIDSQARESAEIAGTCSDGVKCGFAGVYCDDCPNKPNEVKGVSCACGDSYPMYSYGAGFIVANGGVCENCDAAESGDVAGMKFDTEKPRFDLLFADMPLALEAVARVLTFGAAKYADGNWQYVENAERRYLAAGVRHELALAKGERHDTETGEHHLAHKICCDLFRLELALRESGQ